MEAGDIAVDMGEIRADWQDIPLAREMDTLHLELACGPLSDPVAVNIGNPHAVFFVEDAAAVDLGTLGAKLEHDPLFPERANIGVAQLTGPDRLRVRVWERGVGLTRACGTGACAAAAAAHRRGLTGRKVEVRLDGGPLALEWREDSHMVMRGPVATSFTGVFAPSLLP
jgi:diaminopimelate epimerase